MFGPPLENLVRAQVRAYVGGTCPVLARVRSEAAQMDAAQALYALSQVVAGRLGVSAHVVSPIIDRLLPAENGRWGG